MSYKIPASTLQKCQGQQKTKKDWGTVIEKTKKEIWQLNTPSDPGLHPKPEKEHQCDLQNEKSSVDQIIS